MSNILNLTYKKSICKNLIQTNYPILTPYINSLSSYYSIVGATTLITMFGNNFRDFSEVRFGNNTLTSQFINSSQISFYIPYSYTYGTYSIQVFNDNFGSNVIDFTIDNNGSYWALTPATDALNNINSGNVNMNTSVFINYLNSYSCCGAYLISSFNQTFPIFNSIINYSDFYNNSSSNTSSTNIGTYLVSVGSIPIESVVDNFYIINPGFQLIVKQGTTINLQASNLSYKPILVTPNSSNNTSCQLYFWSNSSWTLI